MQKVKFTNSKGESLDFGITPPLVLQRIEGTGNVDADLQSQKSPYQDGKTLLGVNLEPRELFLQTTILSGDRERMFELREEVQKVFNPNLGNGLLEYSTPNGSKYINAVADGSPVFSKYAGESTVCQITLIAHNPFWYDIKENEHEFQTPYLPMFEFPFFTTEEEPIEFGLEQEVVEVMNSGTTSTPLIIEFFGGLKNATLTNRTTGDFITIKKELLVGEVLTINTSFGQRKIEVDKIDNGTENGFKYLTFDSKFLQLEEGLNIIKYSAESESNATVRMRWNNRYLGL